MVRHEKCRKKRIPKTNPVVSIQIVSMVGRGEDKNQKKSTIYSGPESKMRVSSLV